MDLGVQHLPDFRPDRTLSPGYPLRLMLCRSCTLLQLNDLTPREKLYHDRYGFKSGVNEAIRADLEDIVKSVRETVKYKVPGSWLDIGSNDGTLLSYVPDSFYRVGVDPLAQFAEEARQHADVIISDYFSQRAQASQFAIDKFGVITSVSMFYDLADPGQFASEVKQVLAPDGIWVIQQNYALDMMRQFAVDNVCHEHVTYFSVTSLAKLLHARGLEIFRVTYSPVNGGCFRAFASHPGRYKPDDSVTEAFMAEMRAGIMRPSVWRRWAGDVRAELQKTTNLLTSRVTRAGNRCYLYGASTRGGTLLQLAGIGPSLLPCAVERQPAKIGKYMSATGILIISEDQMRADDPEYLLVSPWFFRDVFLEREKEYLDSGGRMIFPLPEFGVVKK